MRRVFNEPPRVAPRSEVEVARALAASRADLRDDEACLAALVEAGIKPAEVPEDWLSIKVRAHDLRDEARQADSIPAMVRDLVCLALFFLAVMLWTMPAKAAGLGESCAPSILGLVVFGLAIGVIAFLAGVAVAARERRRVPTEFTGEHAEGQ